MLFSMRKAHILVQKKVEGISLEATDTESAEVNSIAVESTGIASDGESKTE